MKFSELISFLERNAHGHVFENEGGLIARCGGPGICRECQLQQCILELLRAYDIPVRPKEPEIQIVREDKDPPKAIVVKKVEIPQWARIAMDRVITNALERKREE
jgi:hypothetical protein